MSILQTFAPITKADLKRAAFFGLRLPSPAPQPSVDPGDSWDTWEEDGSTWELGPEADWTEVPADRQVGARPTRDFGFPATEHHDAERLGLYLGMDGVDAKPADIMPDRLIRPFFVGLIAGERLLDLEMDRLAELDPIRDEDMWRPGCPS